MKSLLIFFSSILLILSSCKQTEKTDVLKERETALLTKERAFAEKELEFESLKAMRDSLELPTDTVIALKIPENIIGKWTGKMICTESNCSEHVIGDLRNDSWEFFDDQVRITNKSGSEKIYFAKVSEAEIKLTSENSSPSTTQSIITLQLTEENKGRIKGSREFTGNNCLSKFSVDLEKIKN